MFSSIGAAGRPFTYSWAVLNNFTDPENGFDVLKQFVINATGASIEIPDQLLPVGITLQIELTVSDHMFLFYLY